MIGFIGLGNMGGAIAERLLSHGAKMIAYDTNAPLLQRLANKGALAAGSASEVADRAELIFACLPSAEASLAIANEVCGGAALKIHVELSTIGRHAIEEVEMILHAAGIALVDAPVSGGASAAKRGALSIMVAGPNLAVARAVEHLRPAASKVFRFGEKVGSGQLCKLVNNAIGFTAFLVSCEAVAVGVASGLDAALLIDAINAGSGRNTGTTDKFPAEILQRRFNMGAKLGSGLKDVDLYLAEAEATGMPPAIVASMRDIWGRAVATLGPTGDFTTIIQYFERFVGEQVGAEATAKPLP